MSGIPPDAPEPPQTSSYQDLRHSSEEDHHHVIFSATSPTREDGPRTVYPRPVGHTRSTSFASIASVKSIKSIKVSPKAISRLIIPLIILICISFASMSQTEAAHYLVAEVHYNQPYFEFFLTHVSFAIVFPIHILCLKLFRPSIPVQRYLDDLKYVISKQTGHRDPETAQWKDIALAWSRKCIWMTGLISMPALAWFIAVLFTTAMDVTTIYASSSFFAYFFSMMLLKQPLSRITIGSICLAFGGVLVIVLAGVSSKDGQETEGASNRFLGDIVMMIGAVLLGLYEVVYKLALPEGQGGVHSKESKPSLETYTPLPLHADPLNDNSVEITPPTSRSPSPTHSASGDEDSSRPGLTRGKSDDIPLSPRTSNRVIQPRTSATPLLRTKLPTETSEPYADSPTSYMPNGNGIGFNENLKSSRDVKLPPALHANFLTSCIGCVTICLLWIPIPILHWTGIEHFRWPGSQGGPQLRIWLDLQVVAWTGAIYNAGLMILIGIWGPTTSSVANLLTIGLVAVFDAVWMGSIPDLQTLIGVAMICTGFGILLWEGEED